jgi:hypothetical protein
MKAATIKEIKEELKHLSQSELVELCCRMARFRKENKELITYLLFESHNEEEYIQSVKDHADFQFSEISSSNSLYLVKKSLRKILRTINKYIHYTGSKTAGIQLHIYFCGKIKQARIPINRSTSLTNLYEGQLKKIRKELTGLHEDLQYDYIKELVLLEK